VSDNPFDEFIDQHPAAIRYVTWEPRPPEFAAHLEIETKHGQVAVIDHRTGSVYRRPPRPAATGQSVDPESCAPLAHPARQWRDLTRLLPCAFDGRPRFSRIFPLRRADGTQTGWRFELSTGRAFEYHLHPVHPVVSSDT